MRLLQGATNADLVQTGPQKAPEREAQATILGTQAADETTSATKRVSEFALEHLSKKTGFLVCPGLPRGDGTFAGGGRVPALGLATFGSGTVFSPG